MLVDTLEPIGKFLVQFGLAKSVELPKVEEPKPVPSVPPLANHGDTNAPDWNYLWQTAVIKPEVLDYVRKCCKAFTANKATYDEISKATGVPWDVFACIHKMESNCNFKAHAHNGDPLSARTVQVPKGRPVKGNPPFTFIESAIDALGYDGATGIKDWNIVATLKFLEKFNGLGYRNKGIYSPYMCSGTQHYSKGKYTSDGVFSPNVVSDQLGCIAYLKVLRVNYDY